MCSSDLQLSFDRFGFELKDLKKDNEETKISKKNNFQKNTRRINSLDEFEKRNNEIPI